MEKAGETSNGTYGYDSPPAYVSSGTGYPLEHYAADTAPLAPSYCVPAQQVPGTQAAVTGVDQTDSAPLLQSFVSHIILACVTFCCCGWGCLCGFVALMLAGHDTTIDISILLLCGSMVQWLAHLVRARK